MLGPFEQPRQERTLAAILKTVEPAQGAEDGILGRVLTVCDFEPIAMTEQFAERATQWISKASKQLANRFLIPVPCPTYKGAGVSVQSG